MILCTECYITQNNKTLMLYRNKKENDINKNKWIGFGGKFEAGESPEQCLLREIKEETGVILTEYKLRGLITFNFVDNLSEPIYMFLYTATKFEGEITDCISEGTPEWIDNDKISSLNLWEGDMLFWKWLERDEFFSALFIYDNDTLIQHQVAFY